MEIHIQKDGQKLGPFSEAQIRSGIDAGEFAPDDLAWTTGKASWQPLSSLINLNVEQPPPLHTTAVTPAVNSPAIDGNAARSLAPTLNPSQASESAPIVSAGSNAHRRICKKCGHPYNAWSLFRPIGSGLCVACSSIGQSKKPHSPMYKAATVVFWVCFVGYCLYLNHRMPTQYHDPLAIDSRTQQQVLTDKYLRQVPLSKSGTINFGPIIEEPSDFSVDKHRHIFDPTPTPRRNNIGVPFTASTRSASDGIRTVGLRADESDFIVKYGKPTFKEPSDLKPVEFREHFEDGDLNLMVLFWHNQAHSIIVGRKDGQRLTTEDVNNALKTYSDGKVWVVVASSDDGHSKDWKRDGASAFLLDSRSSDLAAGLPINSFVVTTNELSAVMDHLEP